MFVIPVYSQDGLDSSWDESHVAEVVKKHVLSGGYGMVRFLLLDKLSGF